MDDPGFEFWQGQECVYPKRPDMLWGVSTKRPVMLWGVCTKRPDMSWGVSTKRPDMLWCVSPKRPDMLWGSPSLQLSGYRSSLNGVMRLGPEAVHLPPCSTEVYSDWSLTSTPPTHMPLRHRQGQLCFLL